MSDYSIAEAKARFTQIVHQVESGQAIRITRRGRPAAVLLSVAELERLAAPREGFVAFAKAWRAQAKAQGLEMFDEGEIGGLRDHSDRAAPDLA